MIQTQRLTAALTPLEVALGLLYRDLRPVDAIEVSLAEAIGCVASQTPPLETALPAFTTAMTDGWALRAHDIVGASSYSPVQLAKPLRWVEAGERLPDDCDCVLDADLVEQIGPLCQVVAEAVPSQGVRRAGDDIAAGGALVEPGRRIDAFDLLAVRAAGLQRVAVRSPCVHVIDVHADSAESSQFVSDFAKANGARVTMSQTSGRDVASISAAIGAEGCDLLLTVGGTGSGRMDTAVLALKERGTLLAHGLALQPGRTAAVGKIGATPLVALPGLPEQALGACLAVVQPVLDMLTARQPRQEMVSPLARKISSAIGVTEIVLLKMSDQAWMPLATGQLSLNAIVSADAWLAVPGNSEGYAVGTPVDAFLLREMS
ncbi:MULTISPECIES: molybdopterin-binding protein [unclassified Afipia]|uniref:molybdopterin-binding protein n=1 Tax=unclassified Afipia TaxID=2642050 RepID=UPI000466E08D|nr:MULTISPECIES: molybdopterin-binding protein [unclassified Afipia]